MHLILLYCLSFHLMLGTARGGCSQKCQPSTDVPGEESNNSTVKTPPPFPCSCSPSCSVYRDCCYDSQYRDSTRTVKPSDTMCLTVEGAGQFRSVAKCPPHWPGSDQFCGESIGHLPPVTSRATNVTYANVYCAVCHEDGENLVTWSVELRCCPEHKTKRDRYFSYREEHLWSRLPGDGSRCLCRFQAHHDSTDFLSTLELRDCKRDREVAHCSSSWIETGEDERLCPLYKDPVYAGSRVFKNPHCAKCNFKEERDTQCVPSVVSRMFAAGAKFSEIAHHCENRKLDFCMHYMRAVMGKGEGYSFSRIMSISSSSCVPEPGEMCCKGERYNYKSKRCRKLSSRRGQGRRA